MFMTIVELKRGSATVTISFNEMLILSSALKELCSEMDVNDFPLKVGADFLEVKVIIKQIDNIIG